MILRSTADLRLLASVPRLYVLRRQDVVLDIEAIEDAERARLQARLNKLLHDCGCSAGSLFSLGGGALTAIIAIRAAHYGLIATTAVTFFAVIVFGLAGKLTGLAFASFRFRRLCLAIARREERS
jgi:hypothetical protein